MTSKTYGLAGVMGWPVAHSRSPMLHNHWIRQYGLNGAYVLLPVAPGRLEAALRGLPALGFAGCNITIPHKIDAMALVERVDPIARRIGAINTIVVEADGTLTGRNNDGFGYLQSLRDARPSWRADAGPAVVIGAGGGARAVVVSLAEAGAPEIRIVNRTSARAEALARDVGPVARALAWSARHDALGLGSATTLASKLTEVLQVADAKGYFAFARQGAQIADNVVTEFTQEDVKALGDNIVTILNAVKEMTQPEVMALVQRTAITMQHGEDEHIEPPSMLALLKSMRDPQTRRGMARVLAMLRSVGEEQQAPRRQGR